MPPRARGGRRARGVTGASSSNCAANWATPITWAPCNAIAASIRAIRVSSVSRFLLNYPFAERLFPRALEVIEHVKQWGPAALLTDGDVVFQPRKVDRSGLFEAVAGQVFIYLHKEQELADVEQRCPAEQYVLVEDKLRLLTAVKTSWGSRVTTVFVRQGHYALDPKNLADFPAADISLDRIGDLLQYDLAQLLKFRNLK